MRKTDRASRRAMPRRSAAERKRLRPFDCVRLPDGRIGRVRAVNGAVVRVRVRRRTSATHQILEMDARMLERVTCPKGWMTPAGYGRYLRATLAKMRRRRRR